MRRIFNISFVFILILLSSCIKELSEDYPSTPPEVYWAADTATIADYVENHEDEFPNPETTVSGLTYQIIEEGNIYKKPSSSSTITVDYIGYNLYTNQVVEDRKDFVCVLGSQIYGWQEGLTYIGEGGKIILLIPCTLAFWECQGCVVPPYTPVRYDVYLKKVE